MSTALEAASLIMVPSGYSDGMLGSVKPTDSSGNFTFTRGTDIGATRVAEDGYIEKGRENLLLQSNQFDESYWQKNNGCSIIGQTATDPFGVTNNAWLVAFDGTTNARLEKNFSGSAIKTMSVYVRAQSGTQEVLIGFGSSELVAKTITTTWQRIEKFTPTGNVYPRLRCDDVVTLEVFGFQVELGLAATEYIESGATTGTAGILANLPRIDYTGGGCGSLLLEGSRTNRIPNSEYYQSFANYGTGNSVFESNAAVSPDNTQNAYKIILNIGKANGGGAVSTLAGAFTTGDIIAFSIFFKADEFDEVDIGGYFANESARFNLTDGSVISQKSNVINAYSVPFGDGWYRCTVIYTFQNHVGNNFLYSGYKVIATSNGVASAGDGVKGAFAYGAQFEVGTYPTSYIPTYGTSVTRAVDDVELPTLSSVFDSSGDYTILFEVERLAAPNESQFFYIRSSSFNYITLSAASGGKCEIVLFDGATAASATTPTNSFITGSSIKIAVKISGNNCSAFVNGAVLTLNNTNTIPRGFDRYQNNRNHRKHQEVYFSTALSDAELAELTTI